MKKKKKLYCRRGNAAPRVHVVMMRRQGRRRLFVAVNRSVSDGNAPGAAKISLPINSREVIYFNACSPGSDVGSRGLGRVRERGC